MLCASEVSTSCIAWASADISFALEYRYSFIGVARVFPERDEIVT
jgi:hypothetical protein